MQNGDFLLIDAGAEYFGYAADITRSLLFSFLIIYLSIIQNNYNNQKRI